MKQIFEAYLKLYLNTSEKKNPIESNEEWKIIRKLHYFPSQNAARAVRLLVSSLILGELCIAKNISLPFSGYKFFKFSNKIPSETNPNFHLQPDSQLEASSKKLMLHFFEFHLGECDAINIYT